MPQSVLAPRTYAAAYVALVGLTVATVSLSFARLSPWHLAVGLTFGVVKAALVALFFMHLVRSPGRTWLAAALGLFWLGILIVLSMSDYLTRPQATY